MLPWIATSDPVIRDNIFVASRGEGFVPKRTGRKFVYGFAFVRVYVADMGQMKCLSVFVFIESLESRIPDCVLGFLITGESLRLSSLCIMVLHHYGNFNLSLSYLF